MAPDEVAVSSDDEDRKKDSTKSAATMLVELAHDSWSFGVTPAGEAFARPSDDRPDVVHPLRGGQSSLRAALAKDFFRRYRKVAPQQALTDALLVLEGEAQDAEQATELHLRVAEHEGTIYVDLGDATGQAVRVADGSWDVTDRVPVRFRRTTLMSPLPIPAMGGSLEDLRHRLNVRQDDWPLLVAWLVAVFYPGIPHPVLTLVAEQGTGKTVGTKMLVDLVDPSPVACRKPPKEMDSWVTAASGSWVVALDNLSGLPDWLSDSLCRAVTGDGDVRRRLYTDGDFAVFAFRRCLIMNGIDLGAVRDDLADRMLPITLAPIPADRRRPESEVWAGWSIDRPAVLGALLTAVAAVAAVLPSVRLATSPRMADFARILAAVDRVMGTDGLGKYLDRGTELAADMLAGDPFYSRLAASITEPLTGKTSSEILAMATPTMPEWKEPRTGWPRSPRAAKAALTRLAPTMRKIGWTIGTTIDSHTKRSVFDITPPPKDPHDPEVAHAQPPQPPQPLPAGAQSDAAVAAVAAVALAASQDASAVVSDADLPTTNGEWTTPTYVQHGNDCRYCGLTDRPLDELGICDRTDVGHRSARSHAGG